MTKRLGVQLENQRSLVRFTMETYISLLSFVVRSLRLDGALVIEIKHDHSPIVIVVLYQSTINYTRFVYIYNRSKDRFKVLCEIVPASPVL